MGSLSFSKNKIFICALVLVFGSVHSQVQYKFFLKPLFGVETTISGNALGAFVTPYGGVNFSRHNLLAGINTQICSGHTGGFKIMYIMNLSGDEHMYRVNNLSTAEPDLLQLNWFSYFTSIRNTGLGNSAKRYEQRIMRDQSFAANSALLNTLEGGSGIELKININRNIGIRTDIAVAVYNHLNSRIRMDHERAGLALYFGTAFHYTLQ